MNHSLEQLEISVYQLVQKFETLISKNKHLQNEISYLKLQSEQQEKEHKIAIDQLNQALAMQMDELKKELKTKIEHLTAENQNYRYLLNDSAEKIRVLLSRLPQENTSQLNEENK